MQAINSSQTRITIALSGHLTIRARPAESGAGGPQAFRKLTILLKKVRALSIRKENEYPWLQGGSKICS